MFDFALLIQTQIKNRHDCEPTQRWTHSPQDQDWRSKAVTGFDR